MTYKKVDTLCWVNVDNKDILIIGNNWKGSPLIGTHLDILIISRGLKKKYHDKFLPNALKSCKVVYVE